MIELFDMARRFSQGAVDYVSVGGVAIRSHGGNNVTEDLDICYSRTPDNLKRMANVLSPLNPRPRGIEKRSPFIFDWSRLQYGTDFTFETSIGDVDLLGEIRGLGSFHDPVDKSIVVDLDGYSALILSIPALIIAKKAGGRAKDKAGLKVLYALQEAQSDEE